MEIEAFAVAGWHGVVSRRYPLPRLREAIARLTDPAAAVETLHWGRNYLYVVHLETARGTVPVVVKQFRHESARARLARRLKGSKAERAWATAEALSAAGIDTPEPILRIESDEPSGPSFFVSRFAEGVTEARYLLRAAAAGEAEARFPEYPVDELLDALAALARRLHENGIWFRDLTSGNVLLSRGGTGAGGATAGTLPTGKAEPLRLALVDLNRARLGRRLTVSERSRELARMPILRPEHRERFLRAYWGEPPAGTGDRGQEGGGVSRLRRLLYFLYHHAFLWKNRMKRRLRGLRSLLTGRLVARGTHAHIPKAPGGAPSRERVVWDHLSDQPHLHATPVEKLAARLGDARSHLEEAAAAAGAAPRIFRRYRELRRRLYLEPVTFAGAGVAVRPWPEDPEALLELVAGLSGEAGAEAAPRAEPVPVLLRLHPWEPEGRDYEEALARELAGRGHEVSFALPQIRQLVTDRPRWREAVAEIAERFAPFGRSFQVGQAVNRSKWGVWNPDEYAALLADAREALGRARPEAEILGPAVIDFEYHATAALLNLDRPGLAFDAVSALLYVDRRGAPENRQAGFDTVDKVVLLRAIAETARNAGSERCWITEVNWPLLEGPHAPAGRSVAVDEETQADYLARYYLLALGTGLVERVFWWQAVARGYGLAWAPQDRAGAHGFRRRPAYRALATLVRELGGASFLGPLPSSPPARLYRFRRAGGDELVAGWSAAARPAEAELPRPAREALTRGGAPAPPPAGTGVTLTPSPRYFILEDE
ncbi:MAG TPA: lipopolysaccharide kinase InaA family protein [Thermoanaerobaculia bacterium]|nr:lipopolysaccharide kinase InaA family protein [Thermoanaerobaculia bacterium]